MNGHGWMNPALPTNQSNLNTMLKERTKELLDRYESGEENLTAQDVREELDDIIDNEPWEEPLSRDLSQAVFDYTNQQRESNKYAGRVDDGSDDFIAAVELIVGYGK